MGERIDCDQALERLQDYLKRELTPEVEAEMRAHLERCSPCLGYATFEQNFLLALEQRHRAVGCPDTLRARILTLLRIETGES